MSDSCNNNGSILDALVIYAAIGATLYGLFLIFPLTPGMVLGWELSQWLEVRKEASVVFMAAGAAINYGGYQLLFFILDRAIGFRERVLIYLLATALLLYMGFVIENRFLEGVARLFGDSLLFLLDPTRWFVEEAWINMLLICLYTLVVLIALTVLKTALVRYYYRYRNTKRRRVMQQVHSGQGGNG